MLRTAVWAGLAVGAIIAAAPAAADDNTVTIGLVLPMTGPFASTGKQEQAGARLYVEQHGDMVAGKKIVLWSATTAARPTSPSASRRN